ncbi:MAG: type I 3-dehydroquinate dehydratase [Candidatus Bathyarchaeota archaeon]
MKDKAKICVVIIGRSIKEVEKMLVKAEKDEADLAELRIDYVKNLTNFDLKKVRETTSLPLIATNRPIGEGGYSTQPENDRLNVLLKAAQCNFDYVDMEFSVEKVEQYIAEIKNLGCKTIVSHHNFKLTPTISEMFKLFRRMVNIKADILKIIFTAKRLEDNLECLSFLSKASKKWRIVSFCMGKLGVPSRILSPIFGGEYTYASLLKGKESAKGQLTINELKKIFSIIGA